MTFTHPSILIGLAAVALPVLVHLLGGRRARRVLLPTARFAAGAEHASRARRRLRRVVLMTLRAMAVALAVLALAGPKLEPPRARAATGGEPANRPPEAEEATRGPVRVQVVDAAREAPGPAFYVAAALPEGVPEAPVRTRLIPAAEATEAALAAADVVVWVGSTAPPDSAALARHVEAGGGLVWMPAGPQGPPKALETLLDVRIGPAEETGEGMTIDPGGYTGRLLGAFEGGTAADVSRPVFRRRLSMEADGPHTVRFMDARPAMALACRGRGRVAALAFGPSRAWGDLASRPEFVVLAHSLVEGVYGGAGRAPGAGDGMGAPVVLRSQDRGSRGAAWSALALLAVLALEGWVATGVFRRPACAALSPR